MRDAKRSVIWGVVILVIAFMSMAFLPSQLSPEVGDPVAGAHLYVAWNQVLGEELPTSNHPLWQGDILRISPGETWLCVNCHGWDYTGVAYDYIERLDELVYYPSLLEVSEMEEHEILAWLDGSNNPDHDFSLYFHASAKLNLIAFLQQGIREYAAFVDPQTLDVDADPSSGEDYYKEECMQCHGFEGEQINFGSVQNPEFLGNIGAENPYRMYYVVEFGHRSVDEIIYGRAENWSEERMAELVSYTQFLPLAENTDYDLLDVVDYAEQGDVRFLIWGAIGIAGLIIVSTFLVSLRDCPIEES